MVSARVRSVLPSIASASHSGSSGVRGRAPRVLIVEDADDTRELVAGELELAGFVVFQAANGTQGIQRVRECEPDVIVLDLMLPDLNGISIAQIVRSVKGAADPGIVAVTALTSPGVRRAALAAGCNSFIAKPTTAAAVVDEVRRLLEAHSGNHAGVHAEAKGAPGVAATVGAGSDGRRGEGK